MLGHSGKACCEACKHGKKCGSLGQVSADDAAALITGSAPATAPVVPAPTGLAALWAKIGLSGAVMILAILVMTGVINLPGSAKARRKSRKNRRHKR